MEGDAGIGVHGLPVLAVEEDVAPGVGHQPGAVGVRKDAHTRHVLIGARIPDDDAGRGVANGHTIGQDLLHALIRGKLLALLDADGGEEPAGLSIQHLQRLVLNHLVQMVIELGVVGVDGVEGLAGG